MPMPARFRLATALPGAGTGPRAMIKSPHIKETLASGDLTLRQDLEGSGIGNFFSSVEAGLDYTHRHKDKTVNELDLFLKNNRHAGPGRSAVPDGPDFAGLRRRHGRAGRRCRQTCVNNGNYYDIVQLRGLEPFRQVVGYQGRYPDVQGEGQYRFRRPAREYRGAGGPGRSRIRSGLRINTAVIADPAPQCQRWCRRTPTSCRA